MPKKKQKQKQERDNLYSEIQKYNQMLRFRELKNELGLTYGELAERLGYKNLQHIYKFHSGARQISITLAHRIYREFGWRVEYMLGWDDYKTDAERFAAVK